MTTAPKSVSENFKTALPSPPRKTLKKGTEPEINQFLRPLVHLDRSAAIDMIEQHITSLFDAQKPIRVQLKAKLEHLDREIKQAELDHKKYRENFLAEPKYIAISKPKKAIQQEKSEV